MADGPLRATRYGPVLEVILDRPKANAIDAATSQAMGECFAAFRDDPELRVAIITGGGEKFFSAGWDLKEAAEGARPDSDYGVGGFGGLQQLPNLNKPIIAAVNGLAVGGGFELALSADLIIAAEHARFGLPEPRVGLMAAAGGVHRLPRHIPLKIAMGMMLTGKHITAAEAHRWGIANEVVPLKDLMTAAERWAAEISECSPLSVQASKEAAMGGLGIPLQEATAKRYEATTKLFRSKDAIEGPLAFAQKRKPNWSGE